MTGFETFDINAWLVDGFTKHVDADTKKQFGVRRKNPSKLVVGISLLAAVASINSVTVPVATAAQTELVWPQQTLVESDDLISEPEKYWPELVQVISKWEVVEEKASEPIPTIL